MMDSFTECRFLHVYSEEKMRVAFLAKLGGSTSFLVEGRMVVTPFIIFDSPSFSVSQGLADDAYGTMPTRLVCNDAIS